MLNNAICQLSNPSGKGLESLGVWMGTSSVPFAGKASRLRSALIIPSNQMMKYYICAKYTMENLRDLFRNTYSGLERILHYSSNGHQLVLDITKFRYRAISLG